LAKYDVAIIGAVPEGTFGYSSGRAGAETVVVEKIRISVIVPATLAAFQRRFCCITEIYDHFKDAAEYGIEVTGVKLIGCDADAEGQDCKEACQGHRVFFSRRKSGVGAGLGPYEGPGKISVEKDGKKQRLRLRTF